MKRNLFQNVLVMPYKTGDVIDRNGYLSAVVGAVVSSGGSMTVTVEHSEDGENFVPVADERVFPEQQTIHKHTLYLVLHKGDDPHIRIFRDGLR